MQQQCLPAFPCALPLHATLNTLPAASVPASMQVFSRLLLEECRAHLQQVLEESPAAVLCSSSPPNGSTSASGSSRRAEVAAALSDAGAEPLRLLEVQRQSQLHALRFEPAAAPAAAAAGQPGRQPETAAEFSRRCGIRADDLLLLVGRQAAAGAAPGSVSSAPPMALAAVDSVHQQQLPEGRQTQGAQGRARQLLLSARVSLAGGGAGMHAHFTAGTAWQAVRLMSLTPHLRQLQALVAAQRLPPLLLAELLSPATTAAASQRAPAQLAAVQPPLAPPLLAQLQGQYNRSQQVAIAAAAAGYRPAAMAPAAGASGSTRPAAASASQQVVLVQGPPGTGKTSAILGMLSVFLAANTPKCPAGASKPGGGGSSKPGAPPGSTAAQPPRRAPAVVNPTARVLLCAQSNAAVDELCMRLASRGVVGRCALGCVPVCGPRAALHSLGLPAHVQSPTVFRPAVACPCLRRRDGAQRQVSVVRFGPLEALSPDAAVLHIDAAAAAMQTSDAGLGEASGGELGQRCGRVSLQAGRALFCTAGPRPHGKLPDPCPPPLPPLPPCRPGLPAGQPPAGAAPAAAPAAAAD